MDYNNFDNQNYTYEAWDNFTINNELAAKKRFSRVFLSLFLYLLISNIAAMAIDLVLSHVFSKEAYELITGSYYYVWGLNVVVMYVIAFPIFLFSTLGMGRTVRYKKRMSFKELTVMFLICQAAMTVGNIIGTIINSVLGIFSLSSTSGIDDMIMNSPIWIIVLVVVVIGPIVEELMFRKILMDKIGIYGDRIAIVVSAVSFGLFHGNISQFFYAAILGAILAYVYSKTSNIIYPIILHAAVNLFGSVIPFIYNKILFTYETELNGFMEAFENGAMDAAMDAILPMLPVLLISSFISIVMTVLPILGIIMFFKYKRIFYVSDRCEVLIPREKRMSVIVFNVGAILFILICVLTFIINTDLVMGILNPDASGIVPPDGSTEVLPPEETTPDGINGIIKTIFLRR